MSISITVSEGKTLPVTVLMDRDGQEFNQRRVDKFLEQHKSHKILEYCCHEMSSELEFSEEDGELIYKVLGHSSFRTNYEVLYCKTCGITQDVTNGDFIIDGFKLS